MKIVYKPWGKEEWIEQNEYYCYKRIYINSGYKTSYQYHNEKIETNYIISGKAEVWLENDNGVVEKKEMQTNDFFTVQKKRKHRIIAKSDIILQEVSTPQVDDVIRIEDDNNRKNGKIEEEQYNPTCVILASGKGLRLGDYTKNINKALLPINGKAIISHIIEKIPKYIDIIITIGYKGELIKEYCDAAHSERNIIFVNVDDYDKIGNGPGASLLKCKDMLQKPFYFITADCIIDDKTLPNIDSDWIGVSYTESPDIYSTAKIDDNWNVIDFKNKSKNGFEYAYIGLSAIYNYDIFWKSLENNINDGEVINVYMDKNYKVKAKNISWADTGTIENYKITKSYLETQYCELPKNDEYFYNVNNNIIKIFIDEKICQNRIERCEYLKDYIPEITYKGKNTYAYAFVEGDTLYAIDNFHTYDRFLKFLKDFWKIENVDISNDAKLFYHDKTYSRLNKILEKYPNLDKFEYIIDGIQYKSLEYYLSKIDWKMLENCLPSKTFHGDLQFDNIIYNRWLITDTYDDFKLIDWRQSFGNSTEYGDIYYDLAKLYGGLLISYYDIKRNNFSFYDVEFDTLFDHSAKYTFIPRNVKLQYVPSKNLINFKNHYEEWIIENGYDLNKIKILTFIIYLNMMPLHEKPFDLFLFYFAKKLIGNIYE
jgi:NDP-sugar pyrophosphorylase family protein/mannose-6-phosphate isomerase-like protein (cupin superfamily)